MEYKELLEILKSADKSNILDCIETIAYVTEELLDRVEKIDVELDAAVERVGAFMEKEKYIHIPVGTTSDETVIEKVIRK